MNILKILFFYLLFSYIFITNIYASSKIWDLNTDTDYTVSDSNTAAITWWLWQLKLQLTHKWSITDWTNWAVLNRTQWIYVVWNYAYLTTRTSNALEIIDISNPTNPTHVWKLVDWWAVTLRRWQDLVVDWNYVYIAVQRDDALEIINIEDPANPQHVSSTWRTGTIQLNWATWIEKVWNLVYIASNVDDWLEILNVSDPSSPTHVWALTDGTRLNKAEDIKISWNYAYISSESNDSFEVINISDPANPVFAWELTDWTDWANLNWARWITLDWNYAYVAANAWDAIEVIDISDPTNPTHIAVLSNWWGGWAVLNWPENISIDWNFAFIASSVSDAIEVLDISNPYNPSHVTSIVNWWATLLDWAKDLIKIWNYIYVASDRSDALEIIKTSYTNTSPYIIPNTPLLFSWSVDFITTTLWSWNQWNITYQLSKDNWSTWYYLSWSTRLETTAWTTKSNTPDNINYEIQSFNWLAWWTWEFKWKAFLNWNWNQKVELDEVRMDSTSAWTNKLIDFETPGWYTVINWTWTRQTNTVYEWSYSIEADNWWANDSTSCFEVNKTVYNDSTLNYSTSIDSEANYDFLRFYINWDLNKEWSWNIWWNKEILDLTNGDYTFKWCYEKDGSQNTWADTAWVDYIEVKEKPITPVPVILDIIDFETASWYTVTEWIFNRQTNTVYEWNFSIESDNQWVDDSSSCFEATRTLESESTISFYRKVSSEATYDFLKFYVDWWLKWQREWEVDWWKDEYSILDWTHTFKWCYEKDGSQDGWADKGWVDYIVLTTNPNPPVLVPVLDFEVVWGYTVTTDVVSWVEDWQRVTSEKYEWSYSIESQNNWLANTSACFEREQTVWSEDTWIAFYKKVSSIANRPDRDHLIFYIDNNEQDRWSWNSWRSREIYYLWPWNYTLKWCYSKNGSWDDAVDKAWVDFVSLTQDSPILKEVTPVTTPTNDNTPSYTFYSPIAWDIAYSWSCNSATEKAEIWNNTIVFDSLPDWIYTDCTIQVLWSSSNSTVLAVSNFTIDTTRITNSINYPIDASTIENKSFLLDVSYDDENWVDTWSIIIDLRKYDEANSVYWDDLSTTFVDYTWASIWWTWATFPISQLWAWQFKIDFTISDTSWNESTSSNTFIINESPLLTTITKNDSWWWNFEFEFTIENISNDNIWDWIFWFQLDNWTIETSSWWTFSNSWNLFEVVSNTWSTDVFEPWDTHTISFSWSWDWIVTDLYLKYYVNLSPEVPVDYDIVESALEAKITTDSINGNEYCRNIALTNTWSDDITNWQIQFDLDQTLYNTSSGSFTKDWITHTIDPNWNADIAIWVTKNIKFCTDWLKADNNWIITLVTLTAWDTIAPTISSTDPIEDESKESWVNFDFVFNYSDNTWWDWIDTSSDEITLHKWDWTSYWDDIAWTNMFLWSKTITETSATYPSNDIADWQYKVIFKIYDLNNNFVTKSVVFYVWEQDTTPPDIINNFPTNWLLHPNTNFNISIDYSDTDSNIDTNTANLDIQKWDWSAYWWDLEWTYVSWSNISSTNATYNITKMWFWKYKIYFYIEDSAWNWNYSSIEFYIDEPEFIISTWSLDIWTLKSWVQKFSANDINITVKTVWAWFDIILNKTDPLLNWAIEIIDWNWSNWVWYEQSPYSNTINIINTNETLVTQTWSINTDWNKNIYNYYIKMWALIWDEQAAWSYTWSLSFWLKLDY